ncbi:MAG TPA: HWE histidine kinase domain-containing protein [Sphingomicrobium sp.]|nr:HWE histidine kinase domain-containing protein [Sphingomicrobium sp.]
METGGEQLHGGLRAVLDTALDPVCVMDTNGLIIGWNRHCVDCFGWTADEALGTRLSDLIVPPALRAAHERGLGHFLATGEGPVLNRRIEVSALHRDGEEVPIELSVTASEQFGPLCFVGFVRDVSDRRAQVERQQRQLRESDHRVKNMLTVVSAIAHQTARAVPDFDTFLTDFTGRLDALARSHQLLIGKEWNEVAMSALADQVLGAEVNQGRARFGGPELLLPPSHVFGLSMILHELYTNAVKYGALCGDDGVLALDWSVVNGHAELVWSEVGQTCEREEPSSGFGQRMIAMTVKSDLAGTIERDWRPDGLTAVIRFPLAA